MRALRHLRGDDVGLTDRLAYASLGAVVPAVARAALGRFFGRGVDEDFADEACAFALEQACAGRAPVDSADATMRYIEQIARNKYVDQWRAQARRTRLVERLAAEPSDAPDATETAADPERVAALRAVADRLLAAVTPRQRARATVFLTYRLGAAAPIVAPDPDGDPDAWRAAKQARDRIYKDREVGRAYVRAALARIEAELSPEVVVMGQRLVGRREVEGDVSDDEAGAASRREGSKYGPH